MAKLRTKEEAQAVLDASPFNRMWGFEALSVMPGEVHTRLRARPEFYRPGEIIQGGCILTLADVSVWLAAMTEVGRDAPIVTLDIKNTFLKPARSDVYCRASIISSGRKLVYGEAEISDESERVIAHSVVTYFRLERED
ncbi:PaaI family thioesterase [Chromobacterium sp. IIBBL 290-4]|uniref:PaaI family thioesterase n=1 Tax=Chromobacterium sp. IIBBL 290-4 TaxID=2953890 RepID=UPI0020B7AE41|nr:PaaI family thioesterase [Chromobacterium sp. IIBBL 290-4]UTH74292.1 PaaI family thioesterase [Chromobacterium sp. IIBBL 290-4]